MGSNIRLFSRPQPTSRDMTASHILGDLHSRKRAGTHPCVPAFKASLYSEMIFAKVIGVP